jgi:hypothetical protein
MTNEKRLKVYAQKACEEYNGTSSLERYRLGVDAIAVRMQLEDELASYECTLKSFDGDVKAAIAFIVQFNINLERENVKEQVRIDPSGAGWD